MPSSSGRHAPLTARRVSAASCSPRSALPITPGARSSIAFPDREPPARRAQLLQISTRLPGSFGRFRAGTLIAGHDGMLRLEQVRAEILERFERVDRRLAQQEQRLERIHQRAADAVDRVEALSDELFARIDALAHHSLGEGGLTATNAPRQSSARPDATPARAPRGPS